MGTRWVPSTSIVQKWVSDPLELGLWMVVNSQVAARNQWHILCKSYLGLPTFKGELYEKLPTSLAIQLERVLVPAPLYAEGKRGPGQPATEISPDSKWMGLRNKGHWSSWGGG